MDLGELPGYRLALRAHYDAVFATPTPEDLARQRAALAPYLDRVLAALGAPEAGAHLDLGCGAGHLALRLARDRPRLRVVALDASPAALAAVRAAAASNVEATLGDAEDPPAGPHATATALSLLNLMPDKRAALAAWRRVVAGRLVLTDGYARAGRGSLGTGAPTRDELRDAARDAGWRVVREEDLTPLVEALCARGAWSWPEYVRDGFGYALWAME